MKYKIFDNFLNETCFKYLSSLKLKKTNPDEVLNYQNKIYSNGDIVHSCISPEILKNLQDSCHEIAIKILDELAPKKTVNKLLSGVIYLKPESNTGTIIYKNKKGENPNEIKWKKNRALFFSRTEETSWHNYKGDGKNNRIVLVYNLMTTNTKAVCKLEGINYNLIRLREFTNPYIYRFFKRIF